ncbi:hypothetical protein CYLTODRAFT_421181 [Cylindrobasidium torrendii FP15055 ss-10]|uniref:Uncharacterized protein n=1 Tax=Cylindrobasidium torrendii FP15055 ss-10 TaxID=1314674 RepID=A0A0D7BEM6_9AGAR|nr:hypothetical protein CYLTODRAFT_421181 [Cylindrobasidium torrendii FP15055 ss-10]
MLIQKLSIHKLLRRRSGQELGTVDPGALRSDAASIAPTLVEQSSAIITIPSRRTAGKKAEKTQHNRPDSVSGQFWFADQKDTIDHHRPAQFPSSFLPALKKSAPPAPLRERPTYNSWAPYPTSPPFDAYYAGRTPGVLYAPTYYLVLDERRPLTTVKRVSDTLIVHFDVLSHHPDLLLVDRLIRESRGIESEQTVKGRVGWGRPMYGTPDKDSGERRVGIRHVIIVGEGPGGRRPEHMETWMAAMYNDGIVFDLEDEDQDLPPKPSHT